MNEIRATLAERMRDALSDQSPDSTDLLNIFVQEAEELFDVPAPLGVVLGSTQPLAIQPAFATKERVQGLIEVTERRDLLRQALAARGGEGSTRSSGQEHLAPPAAPVSLVMS